MGPFKTLVALFVKRKEVELRKHFPELPQQPLLPVSGNPLLSRPQLRPQLVFLSSGPLKLGHKVS